MPHLRTEETKGHEAEVVLKQPGDALDDLPLIDTNNRQAFKQDDSDGKVNWTARKLVVGATLCMLYAGGQFPTWFFDGTLNLIQADITQGNTFWIPTANFLATASIAPFVGHLRDCLGKRQIAVASALLSCVGCALLGTAHGYAQAVCGVVIQGVGAGIAELSSLAGLTEVVSVRHRGFATGALTAFVVPFAPFVMYTELFTTRGPLPTWRWGAWISLTWNGIVLLGLLLFYFPTGSVKLNGSNWKILARRIDWIGGVLSIGGIALLLMALEAAGSTKPWDSTYTICTFTIGGLTLLGWILWEAKFAPEPMVPKLLFQGRRVVGFALAASFFAGMCFFSLLVYWPIAISEIWAPEPIAIGERSLCVVLGTCSGAVFWSTMISVRRSNPKWILLGTSIMFTAFVGSLASSTPDNLYQSVTLATLFSFSLGGVVVPAATVAITASPDLLIATCAALSLAIRSLGGVVGYSIYSRVFSSKLKTILPRSVGEYALEAGLPPKSLDEFVLSYLSTAANITSIPGVNRSVLNAALLGSQWGYANAMHYIWYTTAGFGICAIICCLALPDPRKYQTNRIAVSI